MGPGLFGGLVEPVGFCPGGFRLLLGPACFCPGPVLPMPAALALIGDPDVGTPPGGPLAPLFASCEAGPAPAPEFAAPVLTAVPPRGFTAAFPPLPLPPIFDPRPGLVFPAIPPPKPAPGFLPELPPSPAAGPVPGQLCCCCCCEFPSDACGCRCCC